MFFILTYITFYILMVCYLTRMHIYCICITREAIYFLMIKSKFNVREIRLFIFYCLILLFSFKKGSSSDVAKMTSYLSIFTLQQ